MVATDQAGYSRATNLVLTTSDTLTVEPVSLRLTPQNVTMVVGHFRTFSLRDDLGRTPFDAVWTVDHQEVANFVATDPDYLQALAAGEVTVTATWRGLTATTHVTVLAAAPTTVGTVLWVAPTIVGEVQQIVQTTAPDGSPRSYVKEGDGDYSSSDMIRGFDGDGGEVWSASADGKVTQLSATVAGGAVAAITNTSTGAHLIRAYDPGGASTDLPDPDYRGGFAVDPRGIVYHVTATGDLVGYDINTGAAQRVALPKSTLQTCTGGTYSAPQGCTSSLYFETAGTPTILWSGRVVVPVVTGTTTYINDVPQRSNDRVTISAFFLNTDGTTTMIPVYWYSREASFSPFKAIPNGDGGVLVAWNSIFYYNDYEAQVATVHADGTVSQSAGIGHHWGDLALGEGHIIAVTQVGPGDWTRRMVTYLTPESGIESWGFLNNQEVSDAFAAQGGGFVINYTDGSMTGPDPGYADMHLKHAQYSPTSNAWIGGGLGRFSSMVGPNFVLAVTDWPSWLGGWLGGNVPQPKELDTTELRKLAQQARIGADTTNPWAFNSDVGWAFENFCLTTTKMAPPNKKKLPSPLRAAFTLGSLMNVVPDAIATLRTSGRKEFLESAIIDVKAVDGELKEWYPNYSGLHPKFQITGFIDVAANSRAGRAGYVPFLIFDTTGDTSVPTSTLALADSMFVAVWQAKVIQHAGSLLQVPAPTLLNEIVYFLSNTANPEVYPGRPLQRPLRIPAGVPSHLTLPIWPVGIPDDLDDLPIVDPSTIIPEP